MTKNNKIRYAYFSESVGNYASRFMPRWGLSEWDGDPNVDLVMYGMYRKRDFELYASHKGKIVVLWRGTDSKKIDQDAYHRFPERKLWAQHYACSNCVSNFLRAKQIVHDTLPISHVKPVASPCERGDSIYCYIGNNSEFYGANLAKTVAKRVGLKLYLVRHGEYDREELMDIYKDCFIGLRLTPHDGLPSTVLELGLMGRRCIYNGEIPHSISWHGVDDICQKIINEYNRRKEPNKHIAKDVRNFIDIDDTWLMV